MVGLCNTSSEGTMMVSKISSTYCPSKVVKRVLPKQITTSVT